MNKPNKLINEKSPYLLQHAYNPVDWYPWCDEAFEKAKQEDKPVFLSIGYSTCHWCHVMERESFEDESVAKLMNEVFVAIKVDREERPDIDGIYMSICQMITGGGGWPLTIIMTTDKKPFFAGTYFPKHNRFNRIGMIELVPRIKEVWKTKRAEINKSAEEITTSLIQMNKSESSIQIDESIFEKAFRDFDQRYDKECGGFGTSPKFPSPHNLMFLLRYWSRYKEPKALEMVEKTLSQMYQGGVYDHVGFGFVRYSTDQKWLVPHFEKMLYDQAMLVMAYTETYLATKNIFYKKVAEEILEYVLKDMTHPEGGFYSAEDADSEGEEGKFYLWDANELRNILEKDELSLAVTVFGIEDSGNWIDESKGMMPGTNIIHLKKLYKQYAEEFNIIDETFEERIDTIRKKLFNYREKRIHPHKDDKILTDWNGLMISAFAKASQAFNEEKYSQAAKKAFAFIEENLTDKKKKLIHRFRKGNANLPAHVDDYAFMINAALDLYETTFEIKYLKKAIELNGIFTEEFWDNENGGFYFTSIYGEQLLTRQKEIYDGAIPSGNSVALLNLVKLSRFTSKTDYEEKATKLIDCFSNNITKSPSVFSQFLIGLSFYFGPAKEIVIAYEKENELVENSIRYLRSLFFPDKIILINIIGNNEEQQLLVPFIRDLGTNNNKTTFYVCENFVCNKPVNTLDELKNLVN